MGRWYSIIAGVLVASLSCSASLAAAIPSSMLKAFVSQGVITHQTREYEKVNRAEAATILVRSQPDLRSIADVLRISPSGVALFPDVREGSWYAPYVEVVFQQGIMRGYSDKTFRPHDIVSVSMAGAMLLRAKGEQVPPTAEGVTRRVIELGWLPKKFQSSPRTALLRGDFLASVYAAGLLGTNAEHRFSASSKSVSSLASKVSSSSSKSKIQSSTQVLSVRSSKNFSMTIPKIGLENVSIIHPKDSVTQKGLLSVLSQGLGHLFAYPGEGGKIMIYGHSSGYPWDVSKYTKIFRTINNLASGDRIYVTYNGKLFTYVVSSKQTVKANDMTPFLGIASKEEIILYTCWPPDSIAERYLVHAVLSSIEEIL